MVYFQPHVDTNSSHLLSIYSVSQTLSYSIPGNFKSRDSAHLTDEATEDHRKEVTCLVTQSWDLTLIHYSPVLPCLFPLLQAWEDLVMWLLRETLSKRLFLGIWDSTSQSKNRYWLIRNKHAEPKSSFYVRANTFRYNFQKMLDFLKALFKNHLHNSALLFQWRVCL